MRSSSRRTCFLDLDGVLVDFIAGALSHHGKELPYHSIRWDFMSQIGFDGLAAADFWSPLGFDFWANLAWHGDGREILRIVEDIFEPTHVAILSSPCATPGCDEGKREWIRRHIPQYRQQTFLGNAKSLLAGPGKILLDDHDTNVKTFHEFRGHAVLVPRPWNARRNEVTAAGSFDLEALAAELLAIVRGE